MNLEKIQSIAFEAMGTRKEHKYREVGYLYHHGLRVGKIACNLRKKLFPKETALDDIIFVGGLFHDISKGDEPHSEKGSQLTNKLIEAYCSEKELKLIEDIILYHNKRNNSTHFENYIKLVQDADVLDHFGSVEIWQNASQNGQSNEGILGTLEWYNSRDSLKYIQDSLNSLNYEFSKKILEERVLYVEQFKKRLEHENKGEILYE